MKRFLLIFLGLVFLISSNIFADEPLDYSNILKELKQMKQRIEQLEDKVFEQDKIIAQQNKLLSKQENQIQENLEKHVDAHLLHRKEGLQLLEGLRLGIGSTFVFQATDEANAIAGDRDENAVSYSLGLELEKEFGDYGKAFVLLEAADGDTVENELTVFSNVNRDNGDSDNEVDVTEAWYEHYLERYPVTLTAGKIDATNYIDINEFANDETTQFLGRIFRDNPAIEFPSDNAAGFRLLCQPFEKIDVDFVVMDADADWDNMFDNIFFGTQINFKPQLLGKDGHYRFIYWVNQRDHTKWMDTSETDLDNWGLALSIDQQLTENISTFINYGWQNPEVYSVDQAFSLAHSWNAGFNIAGDLWGRENDHIGLAWGYCLPSEKYKDANPGIAAKNEGHFEAYYNCYINEHLAVSPDVQVIWNPYGCDAVGGDDAITVLGIRGQVDF